MSGLKTRQWSIAPSGPCFRVLFGRRPFRRKKRGDALTADRIIPNTRTACADRKPDFGPLEGLERDDPATTAADPGLGDPGWTDWPIHPMYLPFVDVTVNHLLHRQIA